MDRHFMNPAIGAHFKEGENQGKGKNEGEGSRRRLEPGKHGEESDLPDIHVASHKGGHTMSIIHKGGNPAESHDFQKGDVHGITQKLEEHLGKGHHIPGGHGQDHGILDEDAMENESGNGPGV